ncbi:predicted protein [Uncinocarpus reesii 1704]|uniref:Shugoshin N-terminal coiled-coil domain-containing protein n=1 Tax=Uncinocarpus reesii (strain UAMH 1704) TaxID=336963 RepID=C4JTA9_UNCRE|nr:uncharacterized protein UREG_05698 [Uncinocarpus reesii 1704]EEP80856.1 predicted protein [Uncinocarpus reesii 1704]
MARLNDLPPATESLESLKRRFVRQNREIARANSIQSARIRTLESEVSRLLTQNVALREEISWLNRELEKRQGSDRLDTQLCSVKEKLETKLAELSALVTDLGSLPQKGGHSAALKRTSDSSNPLQSPTVPRRPAVKPELDSSISDPDRLPVILEDKYYPRFTPEVEVPESPIYDKSDGDISAGIGPPPILSFAADSINPFATEESPRNAQSYGSSPLSQNKSPTFEPRRRRRDSSFLQDIIPDAEPFTESDNRGCHPQRAGSKRKFAVREEEDFNPAYSSDLDGFQFTRLNILPEGLSQETATGIENQPMQSAGKQEPQLTTGKKPGRRALGPKNTNTNLRSPAKKASEMAKSTTEERRSLARTKVKPRNRSASEERSGYNNEGGIIKSDLSQVASDSGSAHITLEAKEISTNPDSIIDRASNSEDIVLPDPDPSDHNASTTTRTRQSRRSRGPVSYAEPNLRDKMRRPTEVFVDAVGEDRFRRMSKSQPEQFEKEHTVYDQSDHCESIGSSHEINEQRTKVLSASTPGTTGHNLGQSTSSIAISALVAGGKKRCQSRRQSESRRYSSNPLLSANRFAGEGLDGSTLISNASGTASPVDISFDGSTEDIAHSQNTSFHTEITESANMHGAPAQRGPATRRRSMMV